MTEEGAGELGEEQLEVLSERFRAGTTFFNGNGCLHGGSTPPS
jgi:hypothetical protein